MRRMTISSEMAELRAEDGDGAVPMIRGYAAVFDAPSKPFGAFGPTEVVRRGAFAKTLAESDQVALWNHDSSKPLARRSVGTLKLAEDERGLSYEFAINLNNSWERDAFEAVKKRSVIGSSFSFVPIRENATRGPSGRVELRELLELSLLEVSPVTFPAYSVSEAQARAILSDVTAPDWHARAALEKIFAQGLTPAQVRASCSDVIELLDRGDWGDASEVVDAERDQMRRQLMLLGAEC